MNLEALTLEEAIVVYETRKEDRKQAMEDQYLNTMARKYGVTVDEYLRIEAEQEEAERLEDEREEAWQVFLGNPFFISDVEHDLNEIALQHQDIEMTLMGL